MARITHSTRRIVYSMVFIAVMAGTGAMMGAVAGVVLALLGKTVLDIGTGIVEFVSASVLTGAAAAFLLGLYMAARQFAPARRRAAAHSPAAVAPVARAVIGSEGQ